MRLTNQFELIHMKTMTCKQLGGACDQEFHANTFEDIVVMSKQHGLEMFKKDDKPHREMMDKMMNLMKSPEAMQNWFAGKRNEFNALPENE